MLHQTLAFQRPLELFPCISRMNLSFDQAKFNTINDDAKNVINSPVFQYLPNLPAGNVALIHSHTHRLFQVTIGNMISLVTIHVKLSNQYNALVLGNLRFAIRKKVLNSTHKPADA